MSLGRLSELQVTILRLAAGVEPSWTLTGGGALAGFHTMHRPTRDLDLFFRGQRELGDLVGHVRERLEAGGLRTAVLRTSRSFSQLDVRADSEAIVLDLVADPTPVAEPARVVEIDGAQILVDTRHQLLVNKLGALLSRSELRDLIDVRALLEGGEDLRRALLDAPGQDAGFSPLTFSWAVQNLPVRKLALALGVAELEIAGLESFRDHLVDAVLREAQA